MYRPRLPALVALIALCASCSSRPVPAAPTGESPVVLGMTESRTTHTAALGHRIVITLPPVSAPDHAWEIASLDTRYLQQRSAFVPGADSATGATLDLLAVRRGVTRVRFVLLPKARAREFTPVALQEVVITIE